MFVGVVVADVDVLLPGHRQLRGVGPLGPELDSERRRQREPLG